MSGLADAARDARAHADVCIKPGCHAVANALEGALAAETAERHEPGDIEGIPTPEEAGFMSQVQYPRRDPQNWWTG